MFELRDCPIHRFICVPKPSRRIEISWQTSERCGARTLSHKEANIRHKFLRPGMPDAACQNSEFRYIFPRWHVHPPLVACAIRNKNFMPHAACGMKPSNRCLQNGQECHFRASRPLWSNRGLRRFISEKLGCFLRLLGCFCAFGVFFCAFWGGVFALLRGWFVFRAICF